MNEFLRKLAEQVGCDFESAAPCPVLAGDSRITAFAQAVAKECFELCYQDDASNCQEAIRHRFNLEIEDSMEKKLRKMAVQAGFNTLEDKFVGLDCDIEAFARLVAEDCAKVAEDIFDLGLEGAHRGEQAIRTAQAIRAKYGVQI